MSGKVSKEMEQLNQRITEHDSQVKDLRDYIKDTMFEVGWNKALSAVLDKIQVRITEATQVSEVEVLIKLIGNVRRLAKGI